MSASAEARQVYETAHRLNALNREIADLATTADNHDTLVELRSRRQALRAEYIDTHALFAVSAFNDGD